MMEACGPLASVIIPTYNAAATLAGAVGSVRRQQAGTLEIIVVDDGSNDATARVVRRLGQGIRYLRQSHQGVAVARNTGLAAATGTYVAWLDADDEWPIGSLCCRLTALQARPEWEYVQGRTLAIKAPTGLLLPADACGESWVCPTLGSGLFRRTAFDRVGTFDTSLRVAEDLDWFIRAREAGLPGGVVEDVSLHYRIHPGSLTRGLDPVAKNLLVTVKRSLNRRRTATTPGHGYHG